MPSEKQASWIRAYLRERIETGEIDASQIDRLTVSEASGIISRNIQQGRPFFFHYVATRKGWSWVFIAQDKRRAKIGNKYAAKKRKGPKYEGNSDSEPEGRRWEDNDSR